jgi:hypothetical protein
MAEKSFITLAPAHLFCIVSKREAKKVFGRHDEMQKDTALIFTKLLMEIFFRGGG